MNNPLALIVEDDQDLALIFSEAMRRAGFETEIFSDGKAALARLARAAPAVVVLDLHLPRLSGRDILHQIRAEERLSKTRIILTTADARMAHSLRDKADVVLLKPVSFDQLYLMAKRLRLRK
jgi:CheY-like chemotaxis protein